MCGCTTLDEVATAVDAGADAVGFIFADSPCRVTLSVARVLVRSVPAFVSIVGVFVNPNPELVAAARAIGCVPQFSGDESPEFCASAAGGRYVKALHIPAGADASVADAEAMASRFPDADLMFDSRVEGRFGGTGRTFAWPAIEALARRRRVIVSGGLRPDNVAACISSVRPFGVDVRTGVETNGVKDPEKMRAFVRAVREIDAET